MSVTVKTEVRKTRDRVPELQAVVNGLERVLVQVGFAGRHKGGLSNAQLAYIHETGSPARNIPARPFLRPGLLDGRAQIVKAAELALRHIFQTMTPSDIASTLQPVAETAENAVKAKIIEGHFAPLSPVTIRRKGHADPLIETGELYDSITGTVEERS